MVKGVVNSKGWFMFPAGRRPRHQLIGDTIEKYGNDLKDCIMVQYNSLHNENLIARGAGTSEQPDMSHEDLITALKKKSVGVNLFDAKDPDLSDVRPSLVYPNEDHLYPDLAEIQGKTYDDEKKEISVMDYITHKCAKLGNKDVSIHPAATHLLFYDMKGSRRGGGQDLPWSEIDKLHAYLQAQGVSEGCLICNGDATDLKSAQLAVSQSPPVLTLKSVGGASEFLSHLFELRQIDGPVDTRRPVGFCKCFPEVAVPEEFRAGVFAPPDEATDEEMIVIDTNNPDAGKVLQKQMAKLLAGKGASEEKMIGFPASEKARLSKAWAWSMLYSGNAKGEKVESDILNYAMLVMNLTVVIAVIYKQARFPGGVAPEAAGDKLVFDILVMLMVIIPVGSSYPAFSREFFVNFASFALVFWTVSGVLLTLNNAFYPMGNYNALRWAAMACESQIYLYRARAGTYSAIAFSPQWSFEDDGGAADAAATTVSTHATCRCLRSLGRC